MSEEVKRHLVTAGSECSEMVYAADHDRIFASLVAGREAAERENESLRSKAHATEQVAIAMRAECDQLKSLLKEAGEELKEMKESVGYRAHRICVIQRIDAALEASR